MTEGCNGGWGILDGFFAQSFGLVDEECAAYELKSDKTCSDYDGCMPVIGVEQAYYVGGYYGNVSEAAMMKEIRARGPVVSDIMPGPDFSIYDTGIFTDDVSRALEELSKGEKTDLIQAS